MATAAIHEPMLPIATDSGMDRVQFGIFMTMAPQLRLGVPVIALVFV